MPNSLAHQQHATVTQSTGREDLGHDRGTARAVSLLVLVLIPVIVLLISGTQGAT